MDDTDIFAKQIEFSYFDIAGYVARLIPKKVWEIKTEKLNLYERVMIAAPATILQK